MVSKRAATHSCRINENIYAFSTKHANRFIPMVFDGFKRDLIFFLGERGVSGPHIFKEEGFFQA
jgi:hypothetical protein